MPRDIETRWILRVDQDRTCKICGSTLREKGGRTKVRNGKGNGQSPCMEDRHEWGEKRGKTELREFPINIRDARAFVSAKLLWEWENDWWLRQIRYV